MTTQKIEAEKPKTKAEIKKEEREKEQQFINEKAKEYGFLHMRAISKYELASRMFLGDNDNRYILTEHGNKYFDGRVWVDIDKDYLSSIVYSYMKNLTYLEEIYAKHVTEVVKISNFESFTSIDKFNKNENLVTFNNGTYDLETYELREFRKEDYITSKLDYDFKPDAECSTWLKFLSEIMTKDEADFLQEFVGYCLTRSTKHQVMPWLVGRPGTGKSVFTETIGKLFGNMATELSLGSISESKFALYAIKDKTLIFSAESGDGTGVFNRTEIVNKIVTGDTISIEEKYGNRINNYRPFAKIIWSMNTAPTIADNNNGIFRRLRYIKIDRVIPPEEVDLELGRKLEAEFEGIIQWAIEGLKRLNERGSMITPETVVENTELYKRDNDKVANFIGELCTAGDGLKVKQSRIYEAYSAWCRRNGYVAESSAKFATKLCNINGVQKYKSNGANTIFGLAIDNDKMQKWENAVIENAIEDAENKRVIRENERKIIENEIPF